MNNNTLRLIAILGTAIFAIKYVIFAETFEHNQGYNYYTLVFTFLGVAIALFVFQSATARLLRNLDVLVPAGIYITATKLTGLLFSGTSANFNLENSIINYTGITISAVLMFVIFIFISIVYAGWQTLVIFQLVNGKKIDLLADLKNSRVWFLRSFVALATGVSLVIIFLLILFTLYFTLPSVLSFSLFIYPYLIVIAALAVVWNLLTALLLPYLLTTNGNIIDSIKESMNLSRKNIAKLAVPVVLQMIIIGWVMIFSLTYYEKTEFGDSGIRKINTTQFNTKLTWTGGYQDDSNWNEAILEKAQSETHATVEFKLMLLLLLLAIVIKIQIINSVWGKEERVLATADDFGSNKQYALIALAVLVIYMLPFEKIFAGMDLGKINEPDLISTTSVKDNPHFDKELMYELPEDNKYQFVGENEPRELGFLIINDVLVGELDGEPGQETIILSKNEALILNRDGKVKKLINFVYDAPRYDDGTPYSYGEGDIVDIDNDGKVEFFLYEGSFGSGKLSPAIFDLEGKIIWRADRAKETAEEKSKNQIIDFENKYEKPKTKILAKDKTDESVPAKLFVIGEDGIVPFDLENNKNVKLVYSDNYKVFREQGSKEHLAVVESSWAIIKNTVDEPLKQTSKSSLSNGIIFDYNNNPLVVYFELDHLGLFDFDWKLIGKYNAPESEIEYKFFEQSKMSYHGDYKKSVFKCEGVEFKPDLDRKPFRAFIAQQSKGDVSFDAMLYIYDENGKLLLNELFDYSSGIEMYVAKEEKGDETLLIKHRDTIWRYNQK